jgi:hypothetical protein
MDYLKEIQKYIDNNKIISENQIAIGNKIIYNIVELGILENDELYNAFLNNKQIDTSKLSIKKSGNDYKVVYMDDCLKINEPILNSLKLKDILISIGYSASTISTVVNKYSSKTDKDSLDNICNVLREIGYSRSKYKLQALNKLIELQNN